MSGFRPITSPNVVIAVEVGVAHKAIINDCVNRQKTSTVKRLAMLSMHRYSMMGTCFHYSTRLRILKRLGMASGVMQRALSASRILTVMLGVEVEVAASAGPGVAALVGRLCEL